MSDQVQIFWDPYLETLVFETPNLNPPSVPPPPVVTPDEFQTPPTTVAIFQRDPNAPLGSFQNPHPPSTGVDILPFNMATPAASVQPPATIQWQLDPSAPLGTYRNAHPYIPPTPATPAAAPPAPTWQADFARIFDSMNLNPSTSEPPVPDPPLQAQPAADGSATAAAPSPQAPIRTSPPSSPHRRYRPRYRSRDRSSSSSGRHVRFADEGARLRANTEAAAQASRRALENELETREYIDAAANAIPPYRHRPRTPTPPPAAVSSLNPTPSSPQTRSSSTASIIDPLTTRDAPIPAAPSRNPGFQDPRREAPARTRRSEMAEVGTHERWPRCTVCEDLPATRGRSGIGICEGCYKEGFVAEERRGRSEERRGRSRERR